MPPLKKNKKKLDSCISADKYFWNFFDFIKFIICAHSRSKINCKKLIIDFIAIQITNKCEKNKIVSINKKNYDPGQGKRILSAIAHRKVAKNISKKYLYSSKNLFFT